MCENQVKSENAEPRGAFYVDGFNLYHPIHETGIPHLKWLNLFRLGEICCERANCRLVKVTFCTAVPDDPIDKRDRHNTYNRALEASGVSILKGHHIKDRATGVRSEKQSDINLALSLMLDAQDDVFDYAFLLSADSDQTATGKFFKNRFPKKKLISIAPINKKPPEALKPYADVSCSLRIEDIERAIFSGHVQGKKGLILRPSCYDPPVNWVHPDNRPKKK